MDNTSQRETLIELRHIHKIYYLGGEEVRANDDISLKIDRGEFVAIVGKSGSGKSTLMNIIGALDVPTDGEYLLGGEDVGIMDDKQLARIRNKMIGFIFQQYNLLPKLNILENVELPLLYAGVGNAERRERAMASLEKVGLSEKWKNMPNQLSGGQQQRVSIARALAGSPSLILADEPTTALDVTIQAQIFELMQDLKNNNDAAILLITHDMGVVAELADNVAVMYMGNIVESGDARAVLTRSAHPYTRALLKSIPVLGRGKKQELEPIKGSTPDPYDRPKGCQFAPRCGYATEQCMQEMPPETEIGPGHFCRCFHNLMGKEGQPDAGN